MAATSFRALTQGLETELSLILTQQVPYRLSHLPRTPLQCILPSILAALIHLSHYVLSVSPDSHPQIWVMVAIPAQPLNEK